ncbi:hypothetical protein GCM10027044_24530 [Hymenobacter ruber]
MMARGAEQDVASRREAAAKAAPHGRRLERKKAVFIVELGSCSGINENRAEKSEPEP